MQRIFDMLELLAVLKGAVMVTPFMTTAHGAPKFDIQRLAEGVLIAAITALVTMWGTQQVMSAQLNRMTEDIKTLSADIREARRVQLEIVPMRNLQVKTLQEAVEKHEARLTSLEARRR